MGLAVFANAQVTFTKASGWLESAYAEWDADGADSYNVYCSGEGLEGVKVDGRLVRRYGNKFRADVPGLKAGSYTLKVVSVKNGTEGAVALTEKLEVVAHDRAGFAFANGRVPGAYKLDGTLKDDAVVVYVSENSKDTVSLEVTVDGKGAKQKCTGLQEILNGFKKGYDLRPLCVRLLGNITDPAVTDKGDILVDFSKKESSALTIEGIGNDATANGWGIRIKNAQNVEVRNLGVMNVNSDEGDNIGLQQDNKYIWVHNCDFFYGDAGSDADQVKGDGALDCKKSTYVTFSYNHFWDNGKSNLLGLSEGTTEGLYITYHHNWYDHSDSRHPRVRFYSAHVYNNYYDGNAKYGIGATKGSSVFAEANYFRNCKYPMMISMQGSDVYAGGNVRDEKNNPVFSSESGGFIKAYNNRLEGSYTFIPYGAKSYKVKGAETLASDQGVNTAEDFDAYVVENRNENVPETVVSYSEKNVYNNFDTDEKLMYSYAADTPEQAKKNVIAYAGRCQGGDFKWTFNNEVDDVSYKVNEDLKKALVAYKGGTGEVLDYVLPKDDSASVVETDTLKGDSAVPTVTKDSLEGDSAAPTMPKDSLDVDSLLGDSSGLDSVTGDTLDLDTLKKDLSLRTSVLQNASVHFDSKLNRLVIAGYVKSVSLINLQGRIEMNESFARNSSGVVMDLSSLNSGVYVVRVNAHGAIVQQKIYKR